MSDGVFIVLEGIDGAGTTTQAELYAKHVRERRRIAHVTREPSHGPIGSLIRLKLSGRLSMGGAAHAQMMALLFAADRLDHVAHEIRPQLADGAIVVSDRYDLSSIAYQSVTARSDGALEVRDGAFERWVRELNRYALRPDVTILLDVDPQEAERRRRMRHAAPELYEDESLQKRLAELYTHAEELLPDDEIIRIDGNAGVDEVATSVREALSRYI